MKLAPILLIAFYVSLTGCTQVIVKKAPHPHDKGFRFNRPKPYLFIGPAAPDEKKGQTPDATEPPTQSVPTRGRPTESNTEPALSKTSHQVPGDAVRLSPLPDRPEEVVPEKNASQDD